MMEIKNIGILGSGAMGTGIAQVFAAAGCHVLLYDQDRSALERSRERLTQNLDKLVARNQLSTELAAAALENIQWVENLRAFHDRALILEAVSENLVIKKRLFAEIELIAGDTCILASNTSSLSIASIASACKKPERVLGLHFFNPAPLMELVEVVPAVQSRAGLAEEMQRWLSSFGKTPVLVRDTPGFIVNRVARPYYGEALRIWEEGLADLSSLDGIMKDRGGFRMGPFELMDFIGHDINYQVTTSVFEAFYYDPRYKPSLSQKRLVEAGYLGRKSGRGFYHYDEQGVKKQVAVSDLKSRTALNLTEAEQQVIFERILVMLINEAADALHWSVASKLELDLAMTKGVNYPKGLLAWADEWGLDRVCTRMDELYDQYREDRYRLSPLLRKMAEKEETFYE